MKSFGLTDKGKVRKDNQDCFIIEKCQSRNCLVLALCDGMGGAKAGGIASQLANKAFVSYVYGKLTSRVSRIIDYRKILREACEEANGVSFEYSNFDEAFNGMGTTIVGGVIKNNGNGYIINVGDSRAYHISRRNNSIRQITRDHSLVGELMEAGAITKEQARTHPQITSSPARSGPSGGWSAITTRSRCRAARRCCSARTVCPTSCRIWRCSSAPRNTRSRSSSAAR